MCQIGKAHTVSQWRETIGAALVGDGGGGYLDAAIGGRTDTGYDESAGGRMLSLRNSYPMISRSYTNSPI